MQIDRLHTARALSHKTMLLKRKRSPRAHRRPVGTARRRAHVASAACCKCSMCTSVPQARASRSGRSARAHAGGCTSPSSAAASPPDEEHASASAKAEPADACAPPLPNWYLPPCRSLTTCAARQINDEDAFARTKMPHGKPRPARKR
eukprot:3463001-Pleurochrysis_carterae.AAC.2